MQTIIRFLSYPTVMSLVIFAELLIATDDLPYWPLSAITVVLGVCAVVLLERIQPYKVEWNEDHNDTFVDILHAAFSLSLIFLILEITTVARYLLPVTNLWPTELSPWIQVLIAGLIIDFGLWFMHRWSHHNNFLWRLHALHHSSERLYWLNGERRHPISAMVLSLPGLLVVVLLGAEPSVIAAWFSIVAVHLAFQHANLDYSLGPLRNIIGVAEVHRWHHKREYQDAQVNFGEFWMIWDQLFGTFRSEKNGVGASDVGIDEAMPQKYLDQLAWPFNDKKS